MAQDPDCIFCKIVAREIPAFIIWEDEKHLAFLDIFPARKAQTVVIPKVHVPSSLFALPVDVYMDLFGAAKVTATLLEGALGAERTMIVGEGLEINHAHLKLYPRFRNEGGLVHGGQQADLKVLEGIANEIRASMQ
ncbi:MAG TPA: HIT family protein [bacterium]|jgi:diadenosine tetraphosphate (Ap4A) HIT family hydrolase